MDSREELRVGKDILEAIQTNNLDSAKVLLEYVKKNGERWDSWRDTETENHAIHEAVIKENLPALKLLLEYKVNVTKKNKAKETALMLALEKYDFRFTKELLKYDKSYDDIGKHILNAIRNGSLSKSKALLEYAKKHQFSWDGWQNTESKNHAIHEAVIKENLPALKLLLEYKANVTKKNKAKKTALMLALEKGDYRFAEELLKYDTNCDNIGQHILNAIRYNRLERAKIYLEYAKKNNIEWDDWHDTETHNYAIHHAILNNNIDAVKLLIQHNVNIMHKNKEGKSTLSLASTIGNENILNIIREYDMPLCFEIFEVLSPDIPILSRKLIYRIKNSDYGAVKSFIMTLPKDNIKEIINYEDKTGFTALTWSVIQNLPNITKILMDNGADYHHNYLDKRNDIFRLNSLALSSEKETKSHAIDSVYDKEIKIVTSYSTKKSIQKRFRKQFLQLIDLYAKWGNENNCNTDSTNEGIAKLKKDIFLKEYSGMQSNLYFESIKENLEKILLALNNPEITLKKRKKEYKNLCKNFAVCSPGLFTHIEDVCHKLTKKISIEKWLAAARTNLIKVYSDRHNSKHKIKAGNTIHTFNSFATYADNQNWRPLNSTKNYKDPHTYLSKIDNDELIYFHAYFVKEYNFKLIRQCIETNINEIFSDLFEECSYEINTWNSTSEDYQRFLRKTEDILDLLDIKCETSEYCELSDDYLKFKLKTDNIVNKICEKLFPQTIYFDNVKKSYVNLIPDSWKEGFNTNNFNFKVWDTIPSNEFTNILFNTISFITNDQAFILIKEMQSLKLFEMACHTKLFKKGLLKIKNIERREFIKTLIYKKNSSYLAEVKNMPAHIAAADDNVLLIDGLVKMHSKFLTIKNNRLETPIHIAVKHGHKEITQQLAEAKLNIDGENIDGDRPLFLAFKSGNLDIAKTLIEHKADINKTHSKTGETLLENAISTSNLEIFSVLSQYNPAIKNPKHMHISLKKLDKRDVFVKKAFEYLCSQLEIRGDDISSENKIILKEAKNYLRNLDRNNIILFRPHKKQRAMSPVSQESKNCVIC